MEINIYIYMSVWDYRDQFDNNGLIFMQPMWEIDAVNLVSVYWSHLHMNHNQREQSRHTLSSI